MKDETKEAINEIANFIGVGMQLMGYQKTDTKQIITFIRIFELVKEKGGEVNLKDISQMKVDLQKEFGFLKQKETSDDFEKARGRSV